METGFRRVRAFHPDWPDWHGVLRLSTVDDRIMMEGPGFGGRYEFRDEALLLRWDDFPAERLTRCNETLFISDKISVPELDKIFGARFGPIDVAISTIGTLVPGTDYEVTLRTGTSDMNVFWQVFGASEYESANLPANANHILDLGANVGLGSVFFGLRYPAARILSVEPGTSNFKQLCRNTDRLGDRVDRLCAAVWYENGPVQLIEEEQNGRTLGAWELKVSSASLSQPSSVLGYTVDQLIDDVGYPKVDILKVDIEGAELEVFRSASPPWLSRVDLIIVETHDRFRPGSEDAVRTALAVHFTELPANGENLFFRRNAAP